jgi:hypothetical protein
LVKPRDGFPVRGEPKDFPHVSASDYRIHRRGCVTTDHRMAPSLIPRGDTMTKLNDGLRFNDPVTRFDRKSDDPLTMYITCGPMLCELRVWSDAEWLESEGSELPIALTRVPGLGWIGAVSVECMN